MLQEGLMAGSSRTIDARKYVTVMTDCDCVLTYDQVLTRFRQCMMPKRFGRNCNAYFHRPSLTRRKGIGSSCPLLSSSGSKAGPTRSRRIPLPSTCSAVERISTRNSIRSSGSRQGACAVRLNTTTLRKARAIPSGYPFRRARMYRCFPLFLDRQRQRSAPHGCRIPAPRGCPDRSGRAFPAGRRG